MHKRRDSPCTLFCAAATCGAIQRINCSFYDLFSLPDKRTIAIDMVALESSFKKLQRQFHPDKFATASVEEKAISAANSSVVNQAYQILKSRVDRINYVLTNYYKVHVLEEGGSFDDPALMAEVFDLRERVDEASSGSDSDANATRLVLLKEVESALEQLGSKLETLMKKQGDAAIEDITKTAVRFKYLSKVREEILAATVDNETL